MCPFQPPKSHRSRKNKDSLSATVIADNVMTQLKESIKESLPNLASWEHELRRLSQNVDRMTTGSQSRVDMSSIEDQLGNLKEGIAEIKGNTQHNPQTAVARSHPTGPVSPLKDTPSPIKHKCTPIEYISEDYLDKSAADLLLQELEKESLIQEGGRQVASYGEYYKYMGSKSKPKPFPKYIKDLMDQLNKDHTGGKYVLNQCLLNKYEGGTSTLPEHSDNELSLNPESSIFTVSVGATRNIILRDTDSGNVTTHPATHGSLYSMTRQSQNFIKHRIDAEPESREGVRYSLTFRCVHWKYFNSTLAAGDSNLQPIKFGEGKGKVGASTPGKVTWSAHIGDLSPTDFMSYGNAVLMVGTNDLKKDTVKDIHDIRELYKLYKSKIINIQKLNPKCKVFICPVLPCKHPSVNHKIRLFNQFLFNDLVQTSFGVTVVGGFGQFLARGHTWTLSENLARPDHTGLHVNEAGTRLLVRLVKASMYSRKLSAGKITSNKTYRNALAHSDPRVR